MSTTWTLVIFAIGVLVEPPKGQAMPVVLISKSARPGRNDVIDLRYGTAMDDPTPFILSVTAEHIVYQTQATPPFNYYQMKAYVDKNAEKLKAVAGACIARGLKAETL